MRLQGKLAAITAGASGMGKAASLKFAKEGAKVAIIDINEAAAIEVKGQIEAAGGTARIWSSPGAGTTVLLSVPVLEVRDPGEPSGHQGAEYAD